MGLFGNLFGRSGTTKADKEGGKQVRYVIGRGSGGSRVLMGNGYYDFEVVGESHCQDVLEEICGGRTEEGVDHECVAIFVLDNANPYDPNAVAVFVEGERVGYLPRAAAREYREAMRSINLEGAAVGCAALIRGGWDRGSGDVGYFGVALDVARPFKFHGDD